MNDYPEFKPGCLVWVRYKKKGKCGKKVKECGVHRGELVYRGEFATYLGETANCVTIIGQRNSAPMFDPRMIPWRNIVSITYVDEEAPDWLSGWKGERSEDNSIYSAIDALERYLTGRNDD